MEDIPEEIQNKEQAVQLQAANSALLFSDGAFEIENADNHYIETLRNFPTVAICCDTNSGYRRLTAI
jgi:hypothetical protein